MTRIRKKIATTILLICYTLLLRSDTIYPFLVLGYIDQLNPAVILMEEIAEEIVLPNNQLPARSDAGMWVDVQITNNGYIILQVNNAKTTTAQKRSQELHEHLRKRFSR